MKMKQILIISARYPNSKDPTAAVFVQQLAEAIADNSVEVTVISPATIGKLKIEGYQGFRRIDCTKQGNNIIVYCPLTLKFGGKTIFGFHMAWITKMFYNHAVLKTIQKVELQPDALYGHFAFPSGSAAAYVGKKINKPSFFAFGESSLWAINDIGIQSAKEIFGSIAGVVSVSSENKRLLVDNQIVSEDKIVVIPNAVDRNSFGKRDKIVVRQELGLPSDKIIAIFVGAFSESKGVLRVRDAIEEIDDCFGLYLGEGDLYPDSHKTIFAGRVSHDDVGKYLAASDIFVLPTLREGCSNAIVEAIACGLPVISSDMPFNDDILERDYSIRVNPNSIDDIRRAIELLCNDSTLRSRMSDAAYKKSEQYDIKQRAKRILRFIEDKSK